MQLYRAPLLCTLEVIWVQLVSIDVIELLRGVFFFGYHCQRSSIINSARLYDPEFAVETSACCIHCHRVDLIADYV